MFQFLTLLWSRDSCCFEVLVKMTTFQMLALFDERFYIQSGLR